MVKRLILLSIIWMATITCWSQVLITGTVISKNDKSPLPSVTVLEKGTKNGTSTTIEGTFSIEVSDPNSTLVFSLIGMRTQEVPLNGQGHVLVKTKWDCHKDYFDSHQIAIYANSGLINTPLGGKIDMASPWILGGVIKGAYSFQTNAEGNGFQNGQVELVHYVGNCDFDVDFRWSLRQFSLKNNLNSKSNSFETDLSVRSIKLIFGYSHLNFNKPKTFDKNKSSGIVMGFGSYFNIPLYPTAFAKVSLYKDKIEYQASVQGGYKKFLCFVNFYKLNSFNEISLGIGTGFNYRLKKQKT